MGFSRGEQGEGRREERTADQRGRRMKGKVCPRGQWIRTMRSISRKTTGLSITRERREFIEAQMGKNPRAAKTESLWHSEKAPGRRERREEHRGKPSLSSKDNHIGERVGNIHFWRRGKGGGGRQLG